MTKAIITEQKQARKMALTVASQILRNNLLILPIQEYVHEACLGLVYEELHKVARGLERRARAIEAEWQEA